MSSKKMSMNGSARNINENPGNYTRATSYGAAKYVKKIDYDKETGEILYPDDEQYDELCRDSGQAQEAMRQDERNLVSHRSHQDEREPLDDMNWG